MEDIKRNEISIFDFSKVIEMEVEDAEAAREMLPFAAIGSTFPHPQQDKRGRQYSWGFVNVDDPKHCDLVSLQSIILRQVLNFNSSI